MPILHVAEDQVTTGSGIFFSAFFTFQKSVFTGFSLLTGPWWDSTNGMLRQFVFITKALATAHYNIKNKMAIAILY